MKITLIAAYDFNRAIGKENSIPWYYKKDFEHFKRETQGKPMIMGRKTWDAIGKPLPGRTSIVVTRDTVWKPEGYEDLVIVAHSPEEALAEARRVGNEVMIIGGAQIYETFLPLADQQIITEIPVEALDADAFYPLFDIRDWVILKQEEVDDLTFCWLIRK